jgi:hypothetical protein
LTLGPDGELQVRLSAAKELRGGMDMPFEIILGAGKSICVQCGREFGRLTGQPTQRYQMVCSICKGLIHPKCFRKTEREIAPCVIEAAANLWGLKRTTLPILPDNPFAASWSGADGYFVCDSCWTRLFADKEKLYEESRRFYESTGRYEDAAKLCEAFGFFQEAGLAREKARLYTVKSVSVNLNDLVERIRTSGLVVPYKCPSCGANLKIDKDSSADGLKFCSYCGTCLDTQSLASILQQALR